MSIASPRAEVRGRGLRAAGAGAALTPGPATGRLCCPWARRGGPARWSAT